MRKNKQNRSVRWIGLYAVCILAVMSCRTSAEYSYIKKEVDFSQYETYAYLPTVDSTESQSLYDNEIVLERVRASVNEQLQERGFSPDPENADILVHIHKMFEEETQNIRTPVYDSYQYYYPGFRLGYWNPYYYTYYNRVPYVYGSYEIEEVEYTEGTIIIDVIDSENNNLIWRGWSEDVTRTAYFVEDIRNYVKNIFDNFPVDPGDRAPVDADDIDMQEMILNNPDPRNTSR